MEPDRGPGIVQHWMTRPPDTIPEECPIRVALGRMRQSAIRHLLVLDGERLVGIVSSRDVGRLVPTSPAAPELAAPVRGIMTEGPITITPDTPVTEAARLLLETRIGALPVCQEDRIVGIFTKSDALEALLSALEAPPRSPA